MNEERNYELDLIQEETDVEITEEEEMNSNSNLGKWILGSALAAGAGVAAYLIATKKKREAKRLEKSIKLLQEMGYIVAKPDEDDEDLCEESEE